MKSIAIFVKYYLHLSETFIYDELKTLKRFRAIVVTKRLLNREVFPWEPIFIYDGRPRDKKNIGYVFKDVKLIHAHFGGGGIAILPIAMKLGIPLLTTFHGVDIYRETRNLLYRRQLKKLFEEGTAFIVRANKMREDVIKLGCPSDKVYVIYGGIDTNKFKVESPPRSKETIKILMCGRFVEKKGFEYGVRAFAQLKNKDVNLSIVGDGKLRPKLEKLVYSLGIKSQVRFLGFCSHNKVKEEMENSDIFLAPHITAKNGDKEGIPTTIKEAMAAALPVISTYHSGIPELVEDEKSGFLVKERDVDELQKKLVYLVEHPELRVKMGKLGREIVIDKFNLFKQIQTLESIYDKLCK